MAHVWGNTARAFTRGELIADLAVHSVGLALALAAGTALIVLAVLVAPWWQWPALFLYVSTLLMMLGMSLAFNMVPRSPAKRLLQRFDQAAIFIFIAGSYSPFLALLGHDGITMTAMVWGVALLGATLKLIWPEKFRYAGLLIYLGLGWSGVLVFNALAATLPGPALIFTLAGGLAYSIGIVFHVWEKLPFHNPVWHGFVVLGASLHLIALLDAMVIAQWGQ